MEGLWLVSYIALWVLFFTLVAVLLSVLRNLGVIYRSLPGAVKMRAPSNLKAGEILPEVTWQTLLGEARPLVALRGMRQAITLVSPSCGPCVEYLRKVDAEPPDPIDETVMRRVIVSLGDAEDTVRLIDRAGVKSRDLVLLDPNRTVSERWGIAATPVTVVVDEELRVVRQVFAVNGDANARPQPKSANVIQHSGGKNDR